MKAVKAKCKILISSVVFFFPQIFDGNANEHEVVTRTFLLPFVAKFVRIRPVTWEKAICLRIELYGCPGNFLGTLTVR